MAEEVLLTEKGYEKLEEELEQLTTVKRREVAKRIKVAREFGDISENSEYDDAKNEQAFIEGRIKEIKRLIDNAKVVKSDEISNDKVNLGTTVRLHNLDEDTFVTYKLVGTAEIDPSKNKISDKSPIGKAMLGQTVGTKLQVTVPKGIINYEIISIKKSRL
ncbi:MAG: transcription elongation factor GreA [Halanaerobiales bacterium]|nr:transcription elongation factor GreA [Halanaerobiales bacterium]